MLGAGGEGRSENLLEIPFAFGSINTVSYTTMPGALIVSRGAFLDAQGTATCPIQFSFLGDPLDGSVGLDVRGMWGGLALCGAAQTNTLNLDLSFANAPSFTGGVGSGEDLVEGVIDVSGQQRHVYGGNTDPHGSSGILRHLSIRHGSTNLGWNMSGNGNETDLLQLGACGSGTVVEHIELLSSADDGLHIFGGLVEVRRVMSAFHAEDAFERVIKAGKVLGSIGLAFKTLPWPMPATRRARAWFTMRRGTTSRRATWILRQSHIARRP